MHDTDQWVIIDTETTGFGHPICPVEIAAQLMQGWEPTGDMFRVLLNFDVRIEYYAQKIHGYSQEYLRQNGLQPDVALERFLAYVNDLPVVSYNLQFDWDRVLAPTLERMAITSSMRRGFCALQLTKKTVWTLQNHKLETVVREFGLSNSQVHHADEDVRLIVRLLSSHIGPHLRRCGVVGFDKVAQCANGYGAVAPLLPPGQQRQMPLEQQISPSAHVVDLTVVAVGPSASNTPRVIPGIVDLSNVAMDWEIFNSTNWSPVGDECGFREPAIDPALQHNVAGLTNDEPPASHADLPLMNESSTETCLRPNWSFSIQGLLNQMSSLNLDQQFSISEFFPGEVEFPKPGKPSRRGSKWVLVKQTIGFAVGILILCGVCDLVAFEFYRVVVPTWSYALFFGFCLSAWLSIVIGKYDSWKRQLVGRSVELQRRMKDAQTKWLAEESVSKLNMLKNEIRQRASEYELLRRSYTIAEAEIMVQAKDIRLEEFLESHSVNEAECQVVPDTFLRTLIARDILTAADISEGKVAAAPGFGPTRVKVMLEWKERLTTEFEARPSRRVLQEQLDALRSRCNERKRDLEAEMESRLRSAILIKDETIALRNSIEPHLIEVMKELKQT